MRFWRERNDQSAITSWRLRYCSLAVAVALLSGGCVRQGEASSIVSATPNVQLRTLDLSLSLRLSETQLEALDHGIPLRLEFVIAPRKAPRQLSRILIGYLPMAKRYQLLADSRAPRYFSSRLQLLAALDRVSLPLNAVGSGTGTVLVRLDRSALPAPMRLPALLDSSWRLVSVPVNWTTSG
ncbi:MAG: DUF4390 domain-containing protein [Pseudomonadota bacterium]|nr:DUF4390 domain-containing protein [Pseudomonadota bacterium]